MPSALPIESRRPRNGHEPVLADEVVASNRLIHEAMLRVLAEPSPTR